MAETLYQIVEDAIFDLRSWAEDNPDEWNAEQFIADTAGCATPVYDADLVRLALENSDLRPANWVDPIARTVYIHVHQKLDAEWGTIVKERGEAEELALNEEDD